VDRNVGIELADVKKEVKKYLFVPPTSNLDASKESEITFIDMHRESISIIAPVVLVHIFWWYYMIANDSFYLFNGEMGDYNRPRYLLSITMLFGSMVAGATSEGGAAIAFPVLTLILGVSPSIARDFGFMIQSIGMTAASFSILFLHVKVEYKSLFYCTIGGTFGVICGLEFVAPLIPASWLLSVFGFHLPSHYIG